MDFCPLFFYTYFEKCSNSKRARTPSSSRKIKRSRRRRNNSRSNSSHSNCRRTFEASSAGARCRQMPFAIEISHSACYSECRFKASLTQKSPRSWRTQARPRQAQNNTSFLGSYWGICKRASTSRTVRRCWRSRETRKCGKWCSQIGSFCVFCSICWGGEKQPDF